MTKLQLTNRQHKLVVQFIKYWIGGGLEFWVGYGIFAVAYSVLHLWWLWGKLAADIIGWSINYFVQRYWAFAENAPRLSEIEHVRRYIIIEVIGFVIDYGIIGWLKYIGISPYFGFMLSAVFFTVWSYLWYRFWVFPETKGKITRSKKSE